MIYKNYLETIGNTPIVRLNKLFQNNFVYTKIEKGNPGGSIKDRIALAMIEDAEKKGLLKKGDVVVEPTSGNTGIGLALVCAVKGYSLILVMPESMSVERRKVMAAYGAKFELSAKERGMNGAIEKANDIVDEINRTKEYNAWMPSQFENPANVNIHRETTAQEIIRDFPDGLDYLIAGVGTGGHLTGTASVLKEKFPQLKVFAVEPDSSAVLSGKTPGPHFLQGIGAGFIPPIMQTNLLDGIILVSKEQAFDYARMLAQQEGIFAGISSGASVAAVAQKIKEVESDKKILTFVYDVGERYLSVENLWE